MLILVRPHASLLDGPAVARHLSIIGIRRALFAVDPDYAKHPIWSRILNAYGWLTGGHTMLPLDTTHPFAIRAILREMQSSRAVVIFPQGTGIDDPTRPDAKGCSWLASRYAGRVTEISLSHQTRWPRVEMIRTNQAAS
jgi:1-acyl-sn-glycerol-3-phosphate acyltransferase